MARIGSRRAVIWTAALVAVAAAAVALTVFEPQALFIDEQVNEPLPSASAEPGVSEEPSEPVVLGRGRFKDLNHDGEGVALALRLADGRRIVRFEDFSVENGPDLYVYLSSAPLDAKDDDDFNKDFVSLGTLKGNKGEQNYTIPARVDLAKYGRVVIWCKRFASGFAVAGLT